MAKTTLNLNFTKMAYIDEANPDTHYTLSNSTWYSISEATPYHAEYKDRNMLFAIASFPASLAKNKLYGIQFAIFLKNTQSKYCSVYANSQTFDADAVTYNTQPREIYGIIASRYFGSGYEADLFTPAAVDGSDDEPFRAYRALNAGSLRITNDSEAGALQMRTVLSGGTAPFAVVTYDSTAKVLSKIVYRSGPASGYFNPHNPADFRWDFARQNDDEFCADLTWGQASASFFWKSASESTYHEISAGTDKTLTVAADTFPANGEISWYVTGTDSEGTTSSTPVYTFSTVAGAASATPVSPSGSIEDGSAPILFSWELSSTDGQDPIRVEGQWHEAGDETWSLLFDLTPAASSFEAAAGTFTAGGTEWRVRAYNIDSVAGEWSTASFICQAAPPPVSGLTATNVPRTTISWQSSGQQAYEISIDGTVVQKDFGAITTSWQVVEPLPDGLHEIQVRVQGVFGLWSQPSSVFVEISNDPETEITLTAQFGLDAALYAEPGQTEERPRFQWYRDGVRIGSTEEQFFTDRLVLGVHSYYAEIWHASGNYTRSNMVSGELVARGTWIALFSGGDWLDITLTDRATDVQQFNHGSVISSQHVSGSRFPVTERSPYRSLLGSYNCAFRSRESAEVLESMAGEMVIVKNRRGKTVIGCLADLTEHEYVFYSAYSFNLQQSEWKDFVTDEND
ncbi:MAG: hypothetical protein II008_13435 [Oscillospiraceae bacterium]|nr:hypothetical protein [Oscillospiraceae bacterium]